MRSPFNPFSREAMLVADVQSLNDAGAILQRRNYADIPAVQEKARAAQKLINEAQQLIWEAFDVGVKDGSSG